MTHQTHFIYGYVTSFIWQKTTQIVKGNMQPPLHVLPFPTGSKEYFINTNPQTGSEYHGLFVTPVVEHWPEWEIAKWVHQEGLIQPPNMPPDATLQQSYALLPLLNDDCPQEHHWYNLHLHFSFLWCLLSWPQSAQLFHGLYGRWR